MAGGGDDDKLIKASRNMKAMVAAAGKDRSWRRSGDGLSVALDKAVG